MRFTNESNYECNYYGKKIKVSPVIINIVGIINDRIKHNWDGLILITGAVGSGKSSLAKTIAGVYQLIRGEKLEIDNFTWSSDGLVEFTEQNDNYEEPIIYDEAIQGGAGKDIMTKGGKDLINALVTKRRKRHLTIVVIDQLQEFNRKFISRCVLTIDCRTKVKGGREQRGYFKIYSRDETLHLYTLLKKNIIRDIKQYRGYNKPFFRFYNSDNIFVDENIYEEKKIEETNRMLEGNSNKINWSIEKIKAFHLYTTTKKSNITIAKDIGVHQNTITNWARDFKEITTTT